MLFVNEGKKCILDWIKYSSTVVVSIELITDAAIAEAPTVTYAGFTLATFGGYANINITGGGWPNASINGSVEGESDGPLLTWTATGVPLPQTIYGLIVVGLAHDGVTPLCLFYHKFAVTQTVTIAGDTITATVKLFSDDFTP